MSAVSTCLFNYSPGPALLPPEVHRQIHEDLNNNFDALPLLELGHRRPHFVEIAERAEHTLRDLLQISDDYCILFLAGGATAQYSMVPMNLGQGNSTYDYINSGHWSERAAVEARKYGTVNIVTELITRADGCLDLPETTQWHFSKQADYCHFVDNETLTGFELPTAAFQTNCPLVSDMTSNFLTRRFDINRFGIVYAGTQKNAGIAGLSIVIIRRELLGNSRSFTPNLLDYTVQTEAQSRYNTPPIFAWYVCGLMLEWTQQQGGIGVMEKRNAQKAACLYEYIDDSAIYVNRVAPQYRSRVNIHFRIKSEQLEERFLNQAEQQGLIGLRGHRIVGGIRASIYNAMPMAGVEVLVEFMRDFEKTV